MAFCEQCGARGAEGARFCGSCGATLPEPGHTPPAAAGAPGGVGRFAVKAALALVAIAVLVGGGLWGRGYLAERDREDRAREQAEVTADFIEGLYTGDEDLIESALTEDDAEHALDLAAYFTWGDGVEVDRDWDGEVLELTITQPEWDGYVSIEIEPDGDPDRCTVEITETYSSDDTFETDARLEWIDGEWAVTRYQGSRIEDVCTSG